MNIVAITLPGAARQSDRLVRLVWLVRLAWLVWLVRLAWRRPVHPALPGTPLLLARSAYPRVTGPGLAQPTETSGHRATRSRRPSRHPPHYLP
jgi:hypothetical protein